MAGARGRIGEVGPRFRCTTRGQEKRVVEWLCPQRAWVLIDDDSIACPPPVGTQPDTRPHDSLTLPPVARVCDLPRTPCDEPGRHLPTTAVVPSRRSLSNQQRRRLQLTRPAGPNRSQANDRIASMLHRPTLQHNRVYDDMG